MNYQEDTDLRRRNDKDEPSGYMPDEYSYEMDSWMHLSDVVKSSSVTKPIVGKFGIGGVKTFTVQTMRHQDKELGQKIFLQCVTNDKVIRLVLPKEIVNLIKSQDETCTKKARTKAGRAQAQARKDRGELPGFMKPKIVNG